MGSAVTTLQRKEHQLLGENENLCGLVIIKNMAYAKTTLDQDDLEEEIFLHTISSHAQVVCGLIQSSPSLSILKKAVWRIETAILFATLLLLVLSIARFDKHGKIHGWLRGFLGFFDFISHLFEGSTTTSKVTDWSELGEHSALYSMQGRRPGNEDRGVIKKVGKIDGLANEEAVHIWAVMDGHGGHFCADYTANNLISLLESSVQQLKLLTSNLSKTAKLKLYEENFETPNDSVLKYLDISRTEYESLSIKSERIESITESTGEDSSSSEVLKENRSAPDNSDEPNSSKCSLVLSSRNKSIEEVPSLPINKPVVPRRFKPKLKPKATPKGAKKLDTEKDGKLDITQYIKQSEILYPKLLKDIVKQFDKELLVEAKKANSIGGTTLILALLDAEELFIANVVDSRAVFANDSGLAVPMSYDHKPCQLKEKKRIQEAGGFVAMNGVWRVMGVLATSRALGDYPLKDKKVVVADPDVLSFNIRDHRMDFAVLASDGLWDTHSNEDAVTTVKCSLHRERL